MCAREDVFVDVLDLVCVMSLLLFTYFGLPLNLYVVINYVAVVSGERRCAQEKMCLLMFLFGLYDVIVIYLFWSSVCCHFNYGAVLVCLLLLLVGLIFMIEISLFPFLILACSFFFLVQSSSFSFAMPFGDFFPTFLHSISPQSRSVRCSSKLH